MAKNKSINTKQVSTFRLDIDVMKRVEALAQKENRSTNNMVETILKRWVKVYS